MGEPARNAFGLLPHHDGSATYLPQPPTELGDGFDVFLRVPADSPVQQVAVRQVADGEPVSVRAELDRIEPSGTRWHRARLTQVNPLTRYRFLTDGGDLGYQWITAAGPRDYDPSDAGDFVSSIHPGGPAWLADAIAYQIFPDRFARSGRVDQSLPDWAVRRPWGDDNVSGGVEGARQLYGGDLYGAKAHLDHIASLGANLLYLTPVFPGPSNHRYNASTFDRVDPLLGGDSAYAELIDAVHRRGMRIIGDLTTNHTGSQHEWFAAAQADPQAPSAGYYYFTEHPHGYVGWMGHRGLPKLNYADAGVLRDLVNSTRAPLRRYLRPPFGLDGWRIDVANMTARHGADDRNHEVARAIRAVLTAERPDAYLVGEHFHDFTGDLDGSGWQGVMNYAGFTKPIWSWLARPGLAMDDWMGVPRPGWPRLPGPSCVASMQAFTSIGWQHRMASMNIISSHDSPRIRTIAGDPALVEVAAAAMFSMPGVPMIWAGDEIGMEGLSGEAGRKPFPWQRPDRWDTTTLSIFRRLAQVRHDCPALRGGSLRWLHVDADRLAFARESEEEIAVVLLARAAGPEIPLASDAFGLQDGEKFDRLYSSGPDESVGLPQILPGSGPGVWIWRRQRR